MLYDSRYKQIENCTQHYLVSDLASQWASLRRIYCFFFFASFIFSFVIACVWDRVIEKYYHSLCRVPSMCRHHHHHILLFVSFAAESSTSMWDTRHAHIQTIFVCAHPYELCVERQIMMTFKLGIIECDVFQYSE